MLLTIPHNLPRYNKKIKNYLVVISIRGVQNSRGVDCERKILALAESLLLASLLCLLLESLKNKIRRIIASYCLEYIFEERMFRK